MWSVIYKMWILSSSFPPTKEMAASLGISSLFLCPSPLWQLLCLMRMMASWTFLTERIWRCVCVCVPTHSTEVCVCVHVCSYPFHWVRWGSREKELRFPRALGGWCFCSLLRLCSSLVKSEVEVGQFKRRHQEDPSYPEGADSLFCTRDWEQEGVGRAGVKLES